MKISGSATIKCDECGNERKIDVNNVEMYLSEREDRKMGWQSRYNGITVDVCPKCQSENQIEIDVWEYPLFSHNDTQVFTHGCTTLKINFEYEFED